MANTNRDEIAALAAKVLHNRARDELNEFEIRLADLLIDQEFLYIVPYAGLSGRISSKSKVILSQLGVTV